MNLTFGIISSIIILALVGIFFYNNATTKMDPSVLGLIATPTLNLNQPFQLYSAQNNPNQAQNPNAQQPIANQPPPPPVQPTAVPTVAIDPNLPASVSATISTSKGDIQIVLYTDKAKQTVNNFISKAKSGFYNGLTFHRVEDWVIQGGDPKGDGTGGGNMPVEFNSDPFVTGSIGMASRGDNIVQNNAQFFITKQESDWLNGKYTNFGKVTEGMDVVNKIAIGDKINKIDIHLTQTEGGLETSP